MRSVFRLLLLLLLFLVLITTQAQSTTPLIILMEGSLYTWSEAGAPPTPFPACQPTNNETIISAVSVSSDGLQISYLSQPQMVADAIAQFGGVGGATVPNNLWHCDLTTNTATLLSSQPEGASFMNADLPDAGVAHSEATWSPDNSKLVWTQLSYPGGELLAVIFNRADNTLTRFPLTVPENPMGAPAPLMAMWGQSGIMIWTIALNEETFVLEENVLIYDEAGNLLRTLQLNPGNGEEDFIYERVLLQDNGQEYIGLLYIDSGWSLVDPMTGTAQAMNGLAELYNPANPDGVSLLFSLDEQYNYLWQIATPQGLYFDPTGQPLSIFNFSRAAIAVSPDGRLAFTVFDGLYIYNNGESTFIPGTEPTMTGLHSLTWGGTAWRVRRGLEQTAAPTQPEATNCPDTQPSRMIVGRDGRVVEATVPNNMRTAPSADAELVGQIPGGSTFSVMDGPVCADGYAWWQVNYNGIVGWTVEGSPSDYFIEPLP